jgi:coenzyme F420-dependent glucose-6-phosphate dehydrogenase
MVELGYALSSEEHSPQSLVRNAQRAEKVGFTFALISDHFHPWTNQQGHSPFVWSILGAIAQATTTLRIGTGVTCPTIRIHPAIIAQAAATTAAMMPNRFFLGLGTGEALNEQILGDHWPTWEIRAAMLEEAIELIRILWQGEKTNYYGVFYTVENARLYTLPETPPSIYIAAGGEKTAELAGDIANGLITTAPKAELVTAFGKSEMRPRPCIGQVKVCYDEDEAAARKTALKYWPTSALEGELGQILPTPGHFEDATKWVTEDEIAKHILCGNDVAKHRKKIQEYVDAGYDHVYIHQIGPNQDGFFKFYQNEILPHFTMQTQR